MVDLTAHHSDERLVAGPIPTPFFYASIDDCNEVEISFLQIATVEGVELIMVLPYLL